MPLVNPMWKMPPSYLDVVKSFGTLRAYWPLNDFDTQSTTRGSITDTEGGSDDTLDYQTGRTGTFNPSQINRMHSTTSTYGDDITKVNHSNIAYTGNVNLTVDDSCWAAIWCKRESTPWVPSGRDVVLGMAKSLANVELILDGGNMIWRGAGGVDRDISNFTGQPDTLLDNPFLLIFTEKVNGSNADYYSFICTGVGVFQLEAAINTTRNILRYSAQGMEFRGQYTGSGSGLLTLSAASYSTGVGPTSVAEATKLWDAGKL